MKSAQTRRRQILVLTPEEKQTVSFIVIALLLGLGTKYYRARHSTPPTKTAIHEAAANAALPAQKRAETKRRKLPK